MAKNTEVATVEETGEVVVFDPTTQFKVKKHVTLPILQLKIGVPYYVTVTEPIVVGKKVEADKDPAHIMTVTNLAAGAQPCQIVLNAVLLSTFEDEYPDAGYVDKTFEIIKGEKKTGKNYHPFSLIELEAV